MWHVVLSLDSESGEGYKVRTSWSWTLVLTLGSETQSQAVRPDCFQTLESLVLTLETVRQSLDLTLD